MTTTAAPAWASLSLPELGQAMEAKQKDLADIFAKHEDISQIPADEATKIKPMNDELTAMGERLAELKELAGIEANLSEAQKAAVKANRPKQPGAKQGQRIEKKDIGLQFVESDAFKAFVEKKQMGISIEVATELLFPKHGYGEKSVLGTDSSLADVDTQYQVQNIRLPGILEPLERQLVVADLFPQGTTSQNAIPYMEETTTTNAAAETAEGAAKPESAIDFTESSSPVRKIATWLPVTEEAFADVPALRSYVNARLRTFVLQREDTQLLVGDGIAPNLEGILNVTGILTQAKGADPTPDAFYKAMTQIRTTAFMEATGIVMHPNDWQDIRLLRTVDGIYIWGSPSEPGPARMWGLPVVATTAITENTGLVGNFAQGAMIFRRESVNLRVADQHSDFAIRNKVAIIAEERLALVVFRPTAFATVTGI